MKNQVKVGLVQFSPQWGQSRANAERMVRFVSTAAEAGAELIIFPELSNIGVPEKELPKIDKNPFNYTSSGEKHDEKEHRAQYSDLAETIPGPTTDSLCKIAKQCKVYVVVGLAESPSKSGEKLFNSAALIGPSGLIGVHHKMHLAPHEKLTFQLGDTSEVYDTELGKIGMVICYDGRFPELPRILTLKGAEMICHIAATPVMGGFIEASSFFQRRVSVRAMENANYYLCCNRTGKDSGVTFFGHSAIGGPDGNIEAYSDSDKEDILFATLTDEKISGSRSIMNTLNDRRPEMYSVLTRQSD